MCKKLNASQKIFMNKNPSVGQDSGLDSGPFQLATTGLKIEAISILAHLFPGGDTQNTKPGGDHNGGGPYQGQPGPASFGVRLAHQP